MSVMYYNFDTNIIFNRKIYNLVFQGNQMNLINGNKDYQDLLALNVENLDEQQGYDVITEFLSCLSISLDAVMIPSFGYISHNETYSENSGQNKCCAKRNVSRDTSKMVDFYPFYGLVNDEQRILARLYRIARSNSDVYFQILFYWHCLVYPETDERHVVEYLNEIETETPKNLEYIKETITRIKTYLKNQKLEKCLGTYVKENVRHSIAHIVRVPKNGRGLELDNLDELRHLWDIQELLKDAAKFRLLYRKKISENRDINEYFKIIGSR